MSLYLDLLKRTLTRTLFMEGEALEKRSKGLDWPGQGDAETMIGVERLTNIEDLAGEVFRHSIPGDFVECGVWRGGATIFMAGIISQEYENDAISGSASEYRRVFVCDSFEGCPQGTGSYSDDPHHTFHFLKVTEEEVRKNFERYNLLGQNVKFVKGWFKDSLPQAPIDQIALLRADGDLYESQMQILTSLYDKVSPGGYVIIDDYYNIAGSHHAVNDFREKRGITSPMVRVDWCAAYWRKQ